jgi:CDP-paratose synthetase
VYKSILLTGATGFLGSNLLESFIDQNYRVVVLKRRNSKLGRIEHLLAKVQVVDIDYTNLDFVFQEFFPDIVVHTACSYGRNGESASEIVKANLLFGIEILEKSITWQVKTFINTDTVLPNNLNIYSKSKSYFRDWLEFQASKIQVVNIRLEHIYGVNDDSNKFIPWLIDQMMNSNDPIKLTSGIQKRDFIYITDVVDAFNVILNSKFKNYWNVFDVATNNFIDVKELVYLLVEKIELKFGLKVREKLWFDVISYRDGEVMIPEINNSKLLKLGWKPKVVIREGLDKILNNYK